MIISLKNVKFEMHQNTVITLKIKKFGCVKENLGKHNPQVRKVWPILVT